MASCIGCKSTGLLVSVDQHGLCKRCQRQLPDAVRAHRLVPFWLSMTQEERTRSIDAWQAGIGAASSADASDATEKPSKALLAFSQALIDRGDQALAEKALLEAIAQSDDPVSVHDAFHSLVELTFAQRDRAEAMERCKQYCIRYINRFKEMKKPLLRAFGGTLPPQPAFYRLATIYEQQGNDRDAIKICNMAIKNNVRDVAKSGFAGRIERIAQHAKRG